jgi:predicted RNA-binding protein with RPS1 domain
MCISQRLVGDARQVCGTPGTDGLVHIGELDEKWVRVVEDICKEGDAPS